MRLAIDASSSVTPSVVEHKEVESVTSKMEVMFRSVKTLLLSLHLSLLFSLIYALIIESFCSLFQVESSH